MKCDAVISKIEHVGHWHVHRGGNITFAQGWCEGYEEKFVLLNHEMHEGRSCGVPAPGDPTVRCALYAEEHGLQHQGWLQPTKLLIWWEEV